MKHTILLLTALLFAIDALSAADATRPNIVILYTDDMGYGDLAANNPDSKIPTPNLDRLAAQGMRFTDAHSSSGICTPSRYALLTGRFHWRKFHGIVNSFDPPVIDAAELTMPEMLKQHGYRTACVGKWHLGWNWSDIQKPGAKPKSDEKNRNKVFAPGAFDWSKTISGGPLSHGFDYYFGDDVPNFPPYAWFENDRIISTPVWFELYARASVVAHDCTCRFNDGDHLAIAEVHQSCARIIGRDFGCDRYWHCIKPLIAR